MAVLACSRLFNLLLDQVQQVIDVANEDLAINDSCHAPYAQETLPTVLVVRLPDVINNACNRVFKEVLVTREHVFNVLVHDGHQLDALLLYVGIARRLIESHHFIHNRLAIVLYNITDVRFKAPNKITISQDTSTYQVMDDFAAGGPLGDEGAEDSEC